MKTHYVSFLWKKLADFSVDDFLGLPWFFLLYVFYPEKLYTPYTLPHKLLNLSAIRVKVYSQNPTHNPSQTLHALLQQIRRYYGLALRWE